jgi:hypothetical protein
MSPQERQLIDDLFDRLAKLESTPRDPEAMSAIMQGLRNAPNAIYPLVQTVLLQDEALRRAGERIQQLEQGQAQEQGQSGGFLDSMRDKIFGQSQRGSVPNVPPPNESRPVWNSGQVLQQTQGQGPQDQGYGQGGYGQGGYGQGGYGGGPGYGQGPYGSGPQSPFGGGGSFLGTAAATAAGFIGGSMLMNSIRGMMGGGHHQSFGDSAMASDRSGASPWSDQSNSSAARDLGVNDIGRGSDHADDGGRSGLFDTASNDDNDRDDMDMDSDFGGDSDSDFA